MKKTVLLVAACASLSFWSCKSETKHEDSSKDSVVDVKEEVEQTTKQVEDSTGKVDVQKLEQMMEDAK